MYVLTKPSVRARCDRSLIFKWSLKGLKSDFSISEAAVITML